MTVWLPVVNAVLSDSTHEEVPLNGVIPFHVVCAGKGCNGISPSGKTNEKIIMGYFEAGPFYGGPLGPHYGPLDRCRLYR